MSRHTEHRFSGSLAEEYELITLAYPEFEAFQRQMINRVVETLRNLVQGRLETPLDPDLPISVDPIRILEIGTGNGFTTRLLLEAIEQIARGLDGSTSASGQAPEILVTSIDNDPEMLARAADHISSPICTLEEADALAFLQDQTRESWDVIASAFTIHNLEREYRDAVEVELYRVLRTDGLFANADKYAPDGQERFEALAYQVERFFDAFISTDRHELLRKWVLHNIDDQSPRYVMYASEAVPRFNALGFRDVTIEGRAHMQAVFTAYKR
ncbi:MAG: class I SAM-dependent methyltransferase [Alkalispirochaeta sp.]